MTTTLPPLIAAPASTLGVSIENFFILGDVGYSAALTRALATSGNLNLFFPPGTYTFGSAVTYSGSRNIEMYGAGPGVTTLVIGHTGTLIACTFSSVASRLKISDFTLTSSTSAGTGAFASVAYPIVGSSPRATFTAENLDIVSPTAAGVANTIAKGFVLSNCWSARLTNIQMSSQFAVPCITGTCLVDAAQCFDLYLDNCVLTYGDAMVYLSDYSEGIRLSSCSAIGTNWLIKQAATGVTTRSGFTALGIWINACETNTQQGGVQLKSVKGGLFAGNQWTQWAGVAGGTAYVGYDLADTQSFVGAGDVFVGGAAVASITGIKLRFLSVSCSSNTWVGSVFEGAVGVAVDFGANTVENAVLGARKEPGSSIVIDNGTGNVITWRTAIGSDASKNPRIFAGSGDQSLLSIAEVANAVNIIQILAGATGASPNLVMGGADANIGLTLTAKGQAGFVFNHGGGTAGVINPGSPTTVNYPVLNASDTGAGVNFTVAGTDANIPVEITPKGTGRVHITGPLVTSAGFGAFGRAAPTAQPTISGSRGGNAALGSLLMALGATGIILDGTAAGLVGDGVTDNTPAFNAALALGDVLIPPGSYRFASQPNAITVARSIIGAGRTATTLFVDYAAGDFFRIGDGAGAVPSYATVQGMVIASNVIRSSGAAIHVFPAHHAVIRDIAIAPGGVGGTLKHFNGIQVDGGANQFGCHIEDFEISSTQGFGIGLRSFPQDIYIRDGVIGFAGGAGIDIQNGSGLYFSQIDVISSGFGISCEPGAGDVIDAVFCDTVLGDSSTADNWRFWGTGKITNVHLTTCWSSNSLGGVGFSFKNPNINGITLGNSTCHGSWLHGVHVVQGKNITIDGCQIGMNSRVGNTGWNEIQIDPNVSHVIVTGNTIGHVGAFEANGAAAYTAFGVYIAAGTGDYISVIGNKINIGFDATGQCLATGSNIVIRDNVGWKTTYSGVFRVVTGTQSVTFPHNLTVTDPNKIIATVSAVVNPVACGISFFWIVQPTVGIGGTVTVWTDIVTAHDFWFSFRISAFE